MLVVACVIGGCLNVVCWLSYSSLHEDRESAELAGLDTAKLIASKSPVAVQGSKVNMNFSRDHSVSDALDFAVSSGYSLRCGV